MRWTTKALIQRVLSSIPAGDAIYYLGQRYAGGFRDFRIDSKVQQGVALLGCLSELGQGIAERRAVEIGTGWTPVIPLLFWLNGQEECHTYDIRTLLKPSLVVESAKQFDNVPSSASVSQGAGDGRYSFEERKRILRDLVAAGAAAHEIMRCCNIHYHAPADAGGTNLSDAYVDVVYSNEVLEHVVESTLSRLFSESHRIIRPGGYMVHLIDPSDHFSHSDRAISSINFLQYSEDSFSKYNSRFIFQNRLRASTWRKMIEDHGFEIVGWRAEVDANAMHQLPLMRLDRAFSEMTAEDICTTSIYVLARRL